MPMTPPVAAIARRCSSLRLRWWSRSARAHECDATTVRVRELEHVVDRRGGQVRDVEQDAEALELRDRAHAGRGQAAARFLVRRAFREQRARPVRERDHPHAEPVEHREQLDVRCRSPASPRARRVARCLPSATAASISAPVRQSATSGVCAASRSSASSWSSVERSDASATSGAT